MHELPAGSLTLLFTDIEGSTRMHLQLGERYTSILEEGRTLLRSVFFQYHGNEVDSQGDALLVAFSQANNAVSAAVAAQDTLAAHPWPNKGTLFERYVSGISLRSSVR